MVWEIGFSVGRLQKNNPSYKVKMKTWEKVAIGAGIAAVVYFMFIKKDKSEEEKKKGGMMSIAKPPATTGSGWS